MNAIGKVGDHLHIVLNPDHGHSKLVLEPQNEAGQVFTLLAIEPGRRLVEQHDRRFERQSACEADNFLQSERQVTDGRVAITFELHNIDDPLDGLSVRDFSATHARQKKHSANALVRMRA